MLRVMLQNDVSIMQ